LVTRRESVEERNTVAIDAHAELSDDLAVVRGRPPQVSALGTDLAPALRTQQ